MATLSAVVITFNEERNIERCLRSIQWADEIILVDSFSTDRTLELARSFAHRVIQHEYDGDIPQRERGFDIAQGEWLFYIDADEEVTPGLRDEIQSVVRSDGPCDGYNIPRKVFVFGEPMVHGGWYPDYTLRLFRKERFKSEHAEVHGGFTVEGKKGRFRNEMNHFTYDSIAHYFSKMNDYTSLQVSNKLKEGVSQKKYIAKLIFSPPSHFLRKFLSNKGYKDGMIGFVMAVLGAISTLSLYAKLWEYNLSRNAGSEELPPITNKELLRYKR